MQSSSNRFQCRHVFTDGRRCGSPALRNEQFCYYHHTTRCPAPSLTTGSGRRASFSLAPPEDRSAIQHAIGEVLRRIAGNQIDNRRAALLLYGLQTASANLQRPTRDSCRETDSVDEVVSDPFLGTLAPVLNLDEAKGPRWSLGAYLTEEMKRQQAEKTAAALSAQSVPAPAPLTPHL